MKWFDLFKKYQIKKIRESKFSYLVITVSLVISTMIAIAIPLINQSTLLDIEKKAKLINGADIKVETGNIVSKKFVDKINELKRDGIITVNVNNVYEQSTKYKRNYILYYLISGDYGINDNIIVCKNLADKLGLKINNKLNISGKNYTISKIEQSAYGVDQQSGMIGYCKISDKNVTDTNILSNCVYLINTKNPGEIKNLLSDADGSYNYTTVNDQRKKLLDKLNISLMALGTINTISIIMTIIAVASSILMIILQRKRDIAIMKCLSIYTKEIKKSLRLEIKLMVVVPIIIGAFFSRIVAAYLLSKQEIQLCNDISPVIKGTLFFIIVYFLFINVATLNISNISALSFFRNSQDGFDFSKMKIIFFSGVYFLAIMFVYSIFYLQQSETVVSCLAIIVLALLFFIFTILLLKTLTLFKTTNSLISYTVNSLASNTSSFALFIISSALLAWLILFGFTFEKTMGDSYAKNVETNIGYNYMMISSRNEKDIVNALSTNKYVGAYSVVYNTTGVIKNNDKSLKQINFGNIPNNIHDVPFKIVKGKPLKDCTDNEILVSKSFADRNKLKLSDKLQVYFGARQYFDPSIYSEYTITGIYESAGINDNLMLHNSSDKIGHVMYMVEDKTENLLDTMENITAVNISIVGVGIQNMVAEYLVYFKFLCLVCALTSLFFNLNIMHIKYFDNTDVMIGQAVGKSHKFYILSATIKIIISFLISGTLALCLYIMIASEVLKLLNIKIVLSLNVLAVPLTCILLLYLFYYFAEVYFINSCSTNYEMLRERR